MKNRKLIILIIGLVGIYGFSDMKLIFYDILKAALGLSDYQLGVVWSAFGVVAVLSYIIGGMIADRIHPSKLIGGALIASGLLHFVMSLIPAWTKANIITNDFSYQIMIIISAGMGVCAVMLFFPASSKLIVSFERNTKKELFGIYYGTGGLLTALLSLLATTIYRYIDNDFYIYKIVLSAYAVVDVIAGVLAIFTLPKIDIKKDASSKTLLWSDIRSTIKNRGVLTTAFVIMCNYSCCAMMTYFTPYLTSEFGLSRGNGMLFSTLRLGVLCFASGILASHLSNYYGSVAKVIRLSFLFMLSSFVILLFNEISVHNMIVAVSISSIICLFTLGIKSIGMSLMAETNIDVNIMGTAVGIISVIGYSPDAWYFPLAGKIIDNGGMYNYTILFLTGVILSILGYALMRLNVRSQ